MVGRLRQQHLGDVGERDSDEVWRIEIVGPRQSATVQPHRPETGTSASLDIVDGTIPDVDRLLRHHPEGFAGSKKDRPVRLVAAEV